MPLGIVSDEEFAKQVGNKQPINGEVRDQPMPGRKPDVPNTPEVVRKFIAEEAINGTPAKIISEAMQISESSISAYKVGATSTASYDEPNKKLKQHTDAIRNSIITKARNRLRGALNEITPEKLKEAKLKDLSAVAKDMSSVIKNIEPQQTDEPNVKFVFFAPPLKKENDYPVITVNE